MKLFSKKYKWDGYWETDYFFKKLNPEEDIELKFEDEVSGSSTPTAAQINAVTYLISHQSHILDALCSSFLTEYDQWKEIYEEHLPVMNSIQDVKQHLFITSIHIDLPEKDGISYVGYGGGCSWDEEHGIGFYTHKLRVLKIGEASLGFSGTWNAYRDLGIEEQVKTEIEENRKHSKLPKRHTPHPKHGLKPSQEKANQGYYYHLIEGGFNEEFIQHFEQGEITTETRTGYVNMSFLERACQSNNAELVEFLLSKKPLETKGCLKQACYNLSFPIIKLLVYHGIDINEKDEWFKDYPIQNVVASIGDLVRNKEPKEDYLRAVELLKWMLQHGANPMVVLNPIEEHDKLEFCFEEDAIKQEIRQLLTEFAPKN